MVIYEEKIDLLMIISQIMLNFVPVNTEIKILEEEDIKLIYLIIIDNSWKTLKEYESRILPEWQKYR